MCQSAPSYLPKVLDKIVSQPYCQLKEGTFLFERLKSAVCHAPVSSLEYLFYEYRITDKMDLSDISDLFQKLSPQCYLSFVMFINNLCPGKLMFMEEKIRELLTCPLEHVLETGQIPLTGQNRIMQALIKLKKSTFIEEVSGLDFPIPFDPCEVINHIDYYLKESDILADLPEFMTVYFSPEQVNPIAFQVESHKLNPFGKKFIEKLLNEERQNMIKNSLKTFISSYPVKLYTKQAFAIYVTLGKAIPWAEHPFILRLIINSYWEHKVHGTT